MSGESEHLITINLSEFEIARYVKLAKRFVELYITEEPHAAGLYIMHHLKEGEQMDIIRDFVIEVFKEEGFEYEEPTQESEEEII